MNDINMCQVDVIVRNDKYGLLDRSGIRRNVYKDIEFTVYDRDGVGHKVKGGYLITDGGYEGLSIFVNPNVPRSDREAIVWSEFIEAVRKDVECTFGILKARFHILKGIRFPEQNIVESTFVTCCILHNMLLELDGYDISAWELDAAWESLSMSPTEWNLPVEEENNDGNPNSEPHEQDSVEDNELTPFAGLEDMEDTNLNGILSLSPSRLAVSNVPITIPIHSPNILRNLLIEHFSVSFKLGRVQWPKNMKYSHRQNCKRPSPVTEPAAIMRALSIVRETLYVKKVIYC